MSNAYFCEVIEPQSDAAECQCSACNESLSEDFPNYMLNRFIQNNLPNLEGYKLEFEIKIEYKFVFNWKCSRCGHIPYSIYVDKFESLVGWYDNANAIGFVNTVSDD